MPFGLTNAPASCQEIMNDILKEFLDITVVVYLDDILIYTNGTLQQHIQDVSKVLDALLKWNLKANLEKCEFYKTEVEFLRFIIGVNKIKIDPSKTNTMVRTPWAIQIRNQIHSRKGQWTRRCFESPKRLYGWQRVSITQHTENQRRRIT